MTDRKEAVDSYHSDNLMTTLIERAGTAVMLVRKIGLKPYSLKNGEKGEVVCGNGFWRAYFDLKTMYGPVWIKVGEGREDIVNGLQTEKGLRKKLNG